MACDSYRIKICFWTDQICPSHKEMCYITRMNSRKMSIKRKRSYHSAKTALKYHKNVQLLLSVYVY